MGKEVISASIDEGLKQELDRRDDLNKSGAINTFLREYLAHGQSTEAALAARRERIEGELDDAKGQVRRLERELDRVVGLLEEKQDRRRDLYKQLDDAELPEHKELSPGNPLLGDLAKGTDLTPEELYVEYVEWSE